MRLDMAMFDALLGRAVALGAEVVADGAQITVRFGELLRDGAAEVSELGDELADGVSELADDAAAILTELADFAQLAGAFVVPVDGARGLVIQPIMPLPSSRAGQAAAVSIVAASAERAPSASGSVGLLGLAALGEAIRDYQATGGTVREVDDGILFCRPARRPGEAPQCVKVEYGLIRRVGRWLLPLLRRLLKTLW